VTDQAEYWKEYNRRINERFDNMTPAQARRWHCGQDVTDEDLTINPHLRKSPEEGNDDRDSSSTV